MKQIKNQAITLAICLSAFSWTACNSNENSETTTTDTMTDSTGIDHATTFSKHATATLSGTVADTTVEGTVKFDALEDGRVKMTIDITVAKKANQSVALHFHEMGSCGDMGKDAMGHWNPTNTEHGKWGEGNFHSGDIGNISLDGSGKGHLEVDSDRWSIGGDSTTNVLNKSIIVHSGVDDYKSQPSGNSGSRIGCGVVSTTM
jgi:superoxide dismutase, Cu-Zn family